MKIKPISVKNWQVGIADSPEVGFGDMRNIDFESIPGVAQIKRLLEKKSSTTVTGLPLWTVKDQANRIYVVDANHVLYTSTDAGVTWAVVTHAGASTGHGNGLTIWKDYLFLFGDTALDVYGPLSGVPAWSNAWQTYTSDTSWHPAITAQDDAVYFGAGRYVGSIIEVVGQNFAPGSGATYTYNNQALDLPEDYRIKTITENERMLTIGTWKGVNIYDHNVGDIFLWDRVNDTFELPIVLKENGCNALFTKDNDTIVFAGIDGRIYGLNGNFAELLRTMPYNIQTGNWVQVYPDAVESFDGRFIFGMSVGSTGSGFFHGIYGLGLRRNEVPLSLSHEYTISTGTNTEVTIGTIKQISANSIVVGWKDGATYGIDLLSTSTVVSSYGAFIDSALYDTSDATDPALIDRIEVHLADDLQANEGVRIKYRESLDDAFTTVGTMDFTTDGAVDDKILGCSIGASQIQLRIEMTGVSTSLKLKEVIIR